MGLRSAADWADDENAGSSKAETFEKGSGKVSGEQGLDCHYRAA